MIAKLILVTPRLLRVLYREPIMKNLFNTLSTTLFDADNVVVYKIPPGEMFLSKWNLKDSNLIWSGKLRLIEQESSIDEEIDDKFIYNILEENIGGRTESIDLAEQNDLRDTSAPQRTLRLKMELYNTVGIPPSVGSLVTTQRDEVWAEVWYNPLRPVDYLNWNSCVANDGQETIQAIPESAKFYKVIAQLPGTGYSNGGSNNEDIDDPTLHIALGLKFTETYDAISFSEGLNIYKRRFSDFIDQLNYELAMNKLDDLHINKVGSPIVQLNTHDYSSGNTDDVNIDNSLKSVQNFETDESSDSDFGEFVEG